MNIVVTISHITRPLIEDLATFLNHRGFSVQTTLPHKESLRPHAHRIGHAEITGNYGKGDLT
jgi:hypothetical protein